MISKAELDAALANMEGRNAAGEVLNVLRVHVFKSAATHRINDEWGKRFREQMDNRARRFVDAYQAFLQR